MLYQAARDINMPLHPTKSKFMTVSVADYSPFEIGNVKISYTKGYIYLGAHIENAPVTD